MCRDFIPVVSKSEACKVFIKNIILIEQVLRKSKIHTDEEIISFYSKIDELIQFLDGRFFQCHKSYIINMDKVVKMKSQTIFFENGKEISIGREKFQCARQHFAGYITRMAKKNLAKPFFI